MRGMGGKGETVSVTGGAVQQVQAKLITDR
jgi:hypothetical protein